MSSTDIKPSATLILLRQTSSGMETLLLKRHKEMAFGSAWVFPGGKIDPEDYLKISTQENYPEINDREIAAAYHAAVRESKEETGVDMDARELVLMSCWTTPVLGHRQRFRTWFFVGEIGNQPIVVDGNEMTDYRWIQIKDAIDITTVRELGMLPPTYNTLIEINKYPDVQSTLAQLRKKPLQIYNPKLIPVDGGFISLYEGDAGYEAEDITAIGARHRLIVDKDGYRLEKTV